MAQKLAIGGRGILPAARQRHIDGLLGELAMLAAPAPPAGIGRVGHLVVILLLVAAPVACTEMLFVVGVNGES